MIDCLVLRVCLSGPMLHAYITQPTPITARVRLRVQRQHGAESVPFPGNEFRETRAAERACKAAAAYPDSKQRLSAVAISGLIGGSPETRSITMPIDYQSGRQIDLQFKSRAS